jgi:hypothetical protein
MKIYNNYLSKILGVEEGVLEDLDAEMGKKTGKSGVLEKIYKENNEIVRSVLTSLKANNQSASDIGVALRKEIITNERELLIFLETVEGKDIFEKAAFLARKIANVGKGFFLKKEYAKEILRKRPPENLLKYLKIANVEDLFEKYDIAEAFSALRFIESNEWMHETFAEAYSGFTPDNFEEREIEIKVLGPEWGEVAKKFVEKKHHNVSHLKEFGVIFINPIKEDMPGKFLRDFALLFHYFHEIEFYSKLFRKYAAEEKFADKLKMLLRGDVPEIKKTDPGEWLIIQRYLFKEDPSDPRLSLPHVNPESLHWMRGERDLTEFGFKRSDISIELWNNSDWAAYFTGNDNEIISFDLEDNAMSEVSFTEGKNESLNYHQREAMWLRIFSEYAGGEEKMEQLLMDNFDKGIIKF